MKRLFMLFFGLPLFVAAQQSNQNVISATRIFPRVDKMAEFEKTLAAHAQKYHSGTFKWRVFEIMSGDDYGGFHITEGPLSWEEIEKRGDLGGEHMVDWNKNVAPLLTNEAKHSYSVYQADLSTVGLTDYSDWIAITRLYVNPGYAGELREWVMGLKKAWVEGKSTVAVYANSSSGNNGFSLVTRYKQGLKERAEGFRPPFRDLYEKANGRDSWRSYNEALRTAVKEGTSELMRFRADLSSK
jgi:hypothetical protein